MTDPEGSEKADEPTRVAQGPKGDKSASGIEATPEDETRLREVPAPSDLVTADEALLDLQLCPLLPGR